jgi:uncharacterized repeat protein (TIGR01451 family)
VRRARLPARRRAPRWLLPALLAALALAIGVPASAMAGPTAYVANQQDDNVSVIDTATNAVVATVPVGVNPFGVAVTPDSSRAYVGNAGSQDLSVIDTATNAVFAIIPVGVEPDGIAISPDGTRAYVPTVSSDSVLVIDTATNTVVTTIPVGTNPYDVAFSPNGTRAYVPNAGTNDVSVIDTATTTVVATIPVGGDPFGVAVTPDGSRAYVTNRNSGTVSVIATATNTVAATVGVGAGPDAVAITPDGTRAYVGNSGSYNVSVIDTATNLVVATVGAGTGPIGMAITPDGARAYVPNSGTNDVTVIDTASNTVVATVPVGDEPGRVAIANARADLRITKAGAPDPVLVGGTLTYTLTVANSGPSAATGVVVTDTLPSNVTLVSATPSQGSCGGAAPVSCSLGGIGVGATVTVTIRVTPRAKNLRTVNTASVRGNELDPNPANNTASTTTAVLLAQGAAFGARVRAPLVTLGPFPSVSRSSPGTSSDVLASATAGTLLSAQGLAVSTRIGPGVAVASAAEVAKVRLLGTAVSADGVRASCGATASAASGATTIARLVVAGRTYANVTPGPNTRITILGVGSLVLNEQTPSPGGITVNALHLRLLLGAGDIVVSQATCVIDP